MRFIDDVQKIKIEKNGKVKDYEVLFTFHSPANKKFYIGYTDNVIGVNGRKNIYVSSYDGREDNYTPITDIDELSMINKALQEIDLTVQGGNL